MVKNIQSSHQRNQSGDGNAGIQMVGLQRRAGSTQTCSMKILDLMEQNLRSRWAGLLDQRSENRDPI
jgi:hypothetical protein